MTTTSDYPVTQVARPPEVNAQRVPITDPAHRFVHGPFASPYEQTIPQNGYGNYAPGQYQYSNGYTNGTAGNGTFPPSYGPPRNPEHYANYPAPNPYENNSRHQPPMPAAQTGYQPQRTASTSSYAGPSNGVQPSYAPQGHPQANAFGDPNQAMQANFQPRGGAPPTPPADMPTNGGGSVVKVDRNLIGTLCTSAIPLKDLDDKDGIYFIWGDLSVRTEDWFSLKFSFFNVGEVLRDATFGELAAKAQEKRTFPSELAKEGTVKREKSLNGIRAPLLAKTAPCLATVFSQCFKVFSAKKFPGVVESTRLNAHFAKQGVKITVRSDKDQNGNPNGKRKRDGEDDEEED